MNETLADMGRWLAGALFFFTLALLFIPVAIITVLGIALMEVPKAYSLLVAKYEGDRDVNKK